MSYFDKVSKEQFESALQFKAPQEVLDSMYESITLPRASTSRAAGADFYIPYGVSLEPGEAMMVATGVRWITDEGDGNQVLLILPRSGLSIKHAIHLANTVAVIDADYYESDNEGHILLKLVNDSDHTVVIDAGDRFMQGIITNFYMALNAVSHDKRDGGFGSTGR